MPKIPLVFFPAGLDVGRFLVSVVHSVSQSRGAARVGRTVLWICCQYPQRWGRNHVGKQRTKSPCQYPKSIPRSGYEAKQADIKFKYGLIDTVPLNFDQTGSLGMVGQRLHRVASLMIHATAPIGGEESQLRQQLQHEAWPVGSWRGIKTKKLILISLSHLFSIYLPYADT